MLGSMDSMLVTILQQVGVSAAKEAVTGVFKKLFKEKKRDLTPAEEARLKKAVGDLIRTATLDDVKEFDPLYEKVTQNVRGATRKSAAKKSSSAMPWTIKAKSTGVK